VHASGFDRRAGIGADNFLGQYGGGPESRGAMRRWLAVAGLVGVLLGSAGGVAGATTHHKPEVIRLPMTYTTNPPPGGDAWLGKTTSFARGNESVSLALWPPRAAGGTLWQAQITTGSGGKNLNAARATVLRTERETAMAIVTEGGATYRPIAPVAQCGGTHGRTNMPLSRRVWLGFYCVPFRLPVGASVAAVGWGGAGRSSSVIVEWYRAP